MSRHPRKCAQLHAKSVKISKERAALRGKKEWTNQELRKLMQALLHCRPNDIEKIAVFVPSRNRQEIVKKIQEYTEQDDNDDPVDDRIEKKESNIDSWCVLVRKMVGSLHPDLSYHLAQVCKVIAATEEMDLPPEQETAIRNVYLRLSELLSDTTTTYRPSHLELGLLYDLVNSVKKSVYTNLRPTDSSSDREYKQDLVIVREYVKWKYSVLRAGNTLDLENAKIVAALDNLWSGFNMNNATHLRPPDPNTDMTTAENTSINHTFTPGNMYTLNPFCIPNNLLNRSDTEES